MTAALRTILLASSMWLCFQAKTEVPLHSASRAGSCFSLVDTEAAQQQRARIREMIDSKQSGSFDLRSNSRTSSSSSSRAAQPGPAGKPTNKHKPARSAAGHHARAGAGVGAAKPAKPSTSAAMELDEADSE